MNVSKLDRTLVRRLLAVSSVSLATATMLVASTAGAQETIGSTPTSVGSSTATVAGGSDHSKVVGRLAILWLGVNGVPIGTGTYGNAGSIQNNTVVREGSPARCGLPSSSNAQVLNVPCRPVLTTSAGGAPVVAAPTIGVRYWLSEKLGLDAGIGLGIYSGSNSSFPYPDNAASQDIEFKRDKTSVFALTFHAGVPIVLGEPSKHYSFQVIPEANVGFASGTIKDQAAPGENIPGSGTPAPAPVRESLKVGGFRLDVGARAGAEIQFGFLGIPELALQGTVGLYFTYRSVSATTGNKTASDSDTAISTSVQQAPWAIFTNNISALYYF